MIKNLVKLQNELKCPKSLRNNFGGFNYRSAERILQDLKPLLLKYDLQLLLSDDIVAVGDRIYVKATATIKDGDGNTETVTAYAREALSSKGMSDPQNTGSASSYARKYALSALALIDESEADPDAHEATDDRIITAKEAERLRLAVEKSGRTVEQALTACHIKSLDDMTVNQMHWILRQCA